MITQKRTAIWALFLMLLTFSNIPAQKIWDETEAQKQKRMAWWTEARFGMFIHWGLYALPARHEWVKNRERMTNEQYQKYFDNFNPDQYDPKQWARAARNAGMRYVVITAKHHEGFCLWDSKYTDYKVTNTPYGKDLLKPFVEAFRAEGLRVGFYYSLIDWHHPDFTIDRFHPLRDNQEERAKNKNRNMRRYADYVYNQVEELITLFKPDILWLDFSYPGADGKGRDDWQSVRLLKMVRRLQPDILVDDRADLLDVPGGWDFRTPEQTLPYDWVRVDGKKVPWETCQTFSGSWGYYRDEATWKSVKQLLALLIETVSKGGNLLLKVGPTARGTFDYRALDRLSGIGEWMKQNGSAIYGCTQAPPGFRKPDNCLLTYNPNTKRLYVHVLSWPPVGELHLPGFAGKFTYAQFLHDASEIKIKEIADWKKKAWSMPEDVVTLRVPIVKPKVEIPVIELMLK